MLGQLSTTSDLKEFAILSETLLPEVAAAEPETVYHLFELVTEPPIWSLKEAIKQQGRQ